MKLPDDHDGGAPQVPAAADSSWVRSQAPDVIGMGERPPQWPGKGTRPAAAAVAAAFLLAGLSVGYLGGHLQARTESRPTAPASATPAAAPQAAATALTGTGNLCAVQRGKTLQLGIEIANQSGSVVTLRRFVPVVPLGLMRLVASAWGTCGALPGPAGAEATPSLNAGATGWLTVTFEVLIRCPRPLPVQFKVSCVQSGRVATTELPGFSDLGQVQYTGCPAGQ